MSDPIIPPTPTWVIRPDEIELEDETSVGGRQITYGRWKENGVLIKVLSKQAESSALQELGELWTGLQHPNVLKMFGISPSDADPLYVVTEFQPDGNVGNFLRQYPHADRARIVSDVALGMQYLHACGVVHGSLKPTNILIMTDGKACISDYGMVEVQTSGGSNGHRYFSPEAWKGTISRPSDVFAWAMSTLEIFTSKPPWGILSEKQIFRLVVRQDSRPDRPDEDFALTDHIWGIMEKCWTRDARLRPSFDNIVQLLQTAKSIRPDPRSRSSSVMHSEAVREAAHRQYSLPAPPPTSNAERMPSFQSRRAQQGLSTVSGPPAYEVASDLHHATSAPPSVTQFRLMDTVAAQPELYSTTADLHRKEGDEDLRLMFNNSLRLQSTDTPWMDRRLLAPSLSISTTSSSSGSSIGPSASLRTSSSGGSSRYASSRLRNIGEEPPAFESSRSLPSLPRGYSNLPPAVESAYLKRTPSSAGFPSEYSASTGMTSLNTSSAESLCSAPSTVQSTGTAPNASLLAGALSTEVKEGRKREAVDAYLEKVQILGCKSDKEAQKLVTAGTIPTLITLLRTRAVDGIGLGTVLITLGILTHDPITANTIFRTSTASTLIQIFDAAQSEELATLAVWCLTRICRSAEIASGLLKENLAKLLVTKGLLNGPPRTARMSAWCIGALIRSDAIADSLADMGLVATLCEHLRRCTASTDASPEDYSAALYPVARISRSIKISKALAKGGCVEMLANLLMTAEHPQVLMWSARTVGCLMRPNSSDMAKMLLDAGIARGLARLPSMLPTEEVDPLGAFAFAIQRFSCAEWGGGVRKSLVEAGVVDALLAAMRTASDEPYPQVHIELAYAISLLGDVGGTSIRKEIVNAGGIEILKRVGASAARTDVAKACNLAATSVTGNVWSRNAASAKAALAHEWSGGCPDHLPECPVPLKELQPSTESRR